jgi:hypothetical protein
MLTLKLNKRGFHHPSTDVDTRVLLFNIIILLSWAQQDLFPFRPHSLSKALKLSALKLSVPLFDRSPLSRETPLF